MGQKALSIARVHRDTMTTKEEVLEYLVSGRNSCYYFKTSGDLSQTMLDAAIESYEAIFKQEPSGVLHSEADIDVVPVLSSTHPKLAFRLIEDYPDGGWTLYGTKGIVSSGGV